MKAWILHDIADICLEDAPVLRPGKGEVLVKVRAAGICGSDIPRIYRTGAHVHPLIPGHEFSGIVTETGEGVEESWKGKRVGVFPLIPCGSCAPCRKRQYEMCRNYGYLGSRRDGGFGEYVSVPAQNLIELPDTVSFEEAAMLEPMAVAVHAMRRINPSAGERVAVCGLGTIGLLLLMFLKEAGVFHQTDGDRILVIGNKEFQKQTALQLGVPEDSYCDSRRQNAAQWLRERTEGEGADAFFECVGKSETYSQAVESAAPAGRICLVGNPYSDMRLEKEVYWKILRNQLSVTGTWNSSFIHDAEDDWHYVLKRLSEKRITPKNLITHRLSLEELEKGFHIMRDKTEDYVKIMGIFQ